MKKIYSLVLVTTLFLHPVTARAGDYSFDMRPLVAFAVAPYALAALAAAGYVAYKTPQACRDLHAQVGTENMVRGGAVIAAASVVVYLATREESKEARLMKKARMEWNREAALREKCCIHCEHNKKLAVG